MDPPEGLQGSQQEGLLLIIQIHATAFLAVEIIAVLQIIRQKEFTAEPFYAPMHKIL